MTAKYSPWLLHQSKLSLDQEPAMSQDSERLYPNPKPIQFTYKEMDTLPTNSPKMTPLLLGPDNTLVTCPFCNSNIKSAVKYRSTTRTHITAALCCLICCCCCIPYCMDSAKNTDHYCPSCNKYIGTYEK